MINKLANSSHTASWPRTVTIERASEWLCIWSYWLLRFWLFPASRSGRRILQIPWPGDFKSTFQVAFSCFFFQSTDTGCAQSSAAFRYLLNVNGANFAACHYNFVRLKRSDPEFRYWPFQYPAFLYCKWKSLSPYHLQLLTKYQREERASDKEVDQRSETVVH